jgi:DUF917 family protein
VNTASLILMGIQIANAIAAGVPGAIKAKEAIDKMIAEDRDPTDAEWAELNAITEGLRRVLHEGTQDV